MERRRQFLTGAAGLAGLSVAGCTNIFESDESDTGRDRTPTVAATVAENRGRQVYIPTHRDEMAMKGMAGAGDYRVGLMYTYPHQFWIVTGSETERVPFRDDDTVHLMTVVFDEATSTVLPIGAGVSVEIERDGDLVVEKSPWPMISQSMGFHYGDNFALPGDGTYDVTVSLSSMNVRRFGEFGGTFEERAETTFEMEYSDSERNDLEIRQFENRQGDPGAVSMMDMGMMPLSRVPAPSDLPGRVVGEGASGDATFVVSAVEEPPFVEGEDSYLLVSPRTPYNRVPLPMMALSATLESEAGTTFEGQLSAGIEPTAGYHYGAAVDGISSGDELTITVDSPPQTSRHEGYETAFLDMDAVGLTLE
ncbi:hypothetical protein BRC85_01660 [Halobacteriales archaeon QS_1_69_70]|nr:MAG: hypothetical protein BRC85_01660 [Halobacteriales archaeon QS_1_69_70]